jgi:hypothetical protein
LDETEIASSELLGEHRSRRVESEKKEGIKVEIQAQIATQLPKPFSFL